MNINHNHCSIKARFAPAPTGALHIGSARTAYFNWLYARANNGIFEVRIEDTDASRNLDCSELLELLSWLGINYDRLTYQSDNIDSHINAAHLLVSTGHAYRCYMTDEETEGIRTEYNIVDSPWRDSTEVQDKPYTIKFKMPRDQIITLNDSVIGKAVCNTKELEDVVLLRSNGKPTFILASMVDDHNDGITHVLRGSDHINNTFKHLVMYQAFGWQAPVFGHIPLVKDITGQKFSKRKNAQSIAEFRAMGYLPEAICNTILRLGWSHKDEEIIPLSRALRLFSINGLNKASSCFDPQKLDYLNKYYMCNELTNAQLWNLVKPLCDGWEEIELERARLLLSETAKRSNTLVDIVNGLKYCKNDFAVQAGQNIVPQVFGILHTLKNCEFTESCIEIAMREFAASNHLNFGKEIAYHLRIALTGAATSPSLFIVIASLGRDLVLKRLNYYFNKNQKR